MIHEKILGKIADTPVHRLLWALHRRLFPFPKNWYAAQGDGANSLIRQTLEKNSPCLIGRLGKTETEAVSTRLYQDHPLSTLKLVYRFLSMDLAHTNWETIAAKLCELSGVFPVDQNCFQHFTNLYLNCAEEIDVIGSWLHAETLLQDRMPNVKRIPLFDMEPFFYDDPWTKALEAKRVLVIHPFQESIQSQYRNRELLFANPDILPSFELLGLKAIQSLGGTPGGHPFQSWHDALDSMKQQIDQIEFDVALIGAGAYGLPLAQHVKKAGKKAVHLGGVTQMLFGVYGERWLKNPVYSQLINEHWVRPFDSDKIDNYKSVENGCYW